MKNAKVLKVSIAKEKGQKKKNVPLIELLKNSGIKGDAHAGGQRQVSLLAIEAIDKMRKKGLDVGPGDFAENITTQGIDLVNSQIGKRINIGENALLEITHIGKECHSRCNIYYQAGDCVMPSEGIFAKVLKAGFIKPDDKITLIKTRRENV